MSDLVHGGTSGFIPDVVGAHTCVFRTALPHCPDSVDEVAPDDFDEAMNAELYTTEERIRMSIERELRGQMQGQLNSLQQEVDRHLEEFARRFEEQHAASMRELEQAAVELALAIAERLFRREAASDRALVERVMAEAIR